MPKEIKVYTRTTCAPCKMLKMWLSRKNLPFSEVNVDDNENAMDDVVRLSGYSMVPCTVVTLKDDSQKIISGYNLNQLSTVVQ